MESRAKKTNTKVLNQMNVLIEQVFLPLANTSQQSNHNIRQQLTKLCGQIKGASSQVSGTVTIEFPYPIEEISDEQAADNEALMNDYGIKLVIERSPRATFKRPRDRAREHAHPE